MSTLTFEQIKKLKLEFPFLDDIAEREFWPVMVSDQFKLQVNVQVADGEMLYAEPRFCLPPHYIGTADNKFVGHRYPSVFVIGRDNQAIRLAQWDYNHNDFFIKQVVGDGHDVKAVVLVVEYKMYHNIEDWLERRLDTYAGPFSHRDVRVTIYKAPKKGFARLVEKSRLTSNVRVTDLTGIALSSRNNAEARAVINVLEDVVKSFKKNVGPSLWKRMAGCDTKGMSADYGVTKMMAYTIAGRIMITFQRGGDQISVVGDESDFTRTGLQSMNCTVDVARAMVQDVISYWKNVKLLPEKSVQSDTDVFFG